MTVSTESTDRAGNDSWREVIGAAAAEVARQESRVDVKAGQLVTLAGTLSTLTVGIATAIGVLSTQLPEWLMVVMTPLLIAAGLWVSTVVVLLRRIIRPRLHAAGPGSLVNDCHVDELRTMSPAEYHEALVRRLGGIVRDRYRAVAVASDLLIVGFVPLLTAGVLAAVLSIIT